MKRLLGVFLGSPTTDAGDRKILWAFEGEEGIETGSQTFAEMDAIMAEAVKAIADRKNLPVHHDPNRYAQCRDGTCHPVHLPDYKQGDKRGNAG